MEESPWKRRSDMSRLGLDGGGVGDELNSRTAEKPDVQMTLM